MIDEWIMKQTFFFFGVMSTGELFTMRQETSIKKANRVNFSLKQVMCLLITQTIQRDFGLSWIWTDLFESSQDWKIRFCAMITGLDSILDLLDNSLGLLIPSFPEQPDLSVNH